MPIRESVRRVIVEARALEIGRNLNDYEGALADHVSMLRTGVQMVHERMATEQEIPTIREGIAMASVLSRMEQAANEQNDQNAMLRGFLAYLQATQAVISKIAPGQAREAMEAIGNRLRHDPVMKELLARSEGLADE
jgi:hypothetical protein